MTGFIEETWFDTVGFRKSDYSAAGSFEWNDLGETRPRENREKIRSSGWGSLLLGFVKSPSVRGNR
jgi:hypothetical protein